MTSEGLGEMFEGDSADTCAGKFPLVSMGGRVDPSSMQRWEARTPIGTSGIWELFTKVPSRTNPKELDNFLLTFFASSANSEHFWGVFNNEK